jgi:hypothetical protein
VLRLVAAVSLVGLTGLGPPSINPFDTLSVGWEDIDMASFDLRRLSISGDCSSDDEGDMAVL